MLINFNKTGHNKYSSFRELTSSGENNELEVLCENTEDSEDCKVIESFVDECTVVEDSVIEVSSEAEANKYKQNVVETYETQQLHFKDVTELDTFLLQPTNSGMLIQQSYRKHFLYYFQSLRFAEVCHERKIHSNQTRRRR